jgi:hypothetical protein
VPSGNELMELGATALYGFLESKAKADPAFMLNKVPQPVTQLGYAGNIALIARVANKMFVKNKWLGLFASGAAHAAMYQLGRRGALATDTQVFSIAGDNDEDDMGWDVEGLAVEGSDFDGHVMPGT